VVHPLCDGAPLDVDVASRLEAVIAIVAERSRRWRRPCDRFVAIGIVRSATSPRSKQSSASSTVRADGRDSRGSRMR
jgi:hypothetical protein